MKEPIHEFLQYEERPEECEGISVNCKNDTIYVALPDHQDVVRLTRREVDLEGEDYYLHDEGSRVVWVHPSRLLEFIKPDLVVGDLDDIKSIYNPRR